MAKAVWSSEFKLLKMSYLQFPKRSSRIIAIEGVFQKRGSGSLWNDVTGGLKLRLRPIRRLRPHGHFSYVVVDS